MSRYAYGGQALIEGVLMRGRDAIAVALRDSDGRIVHATERLDSGLRGKPWARLPFLRGLVVLYETLVVGTRWLVRSANVQAKADDVELGKGSIIITMLITFGAAIAIFSLLPLFVSSVATEGVETRFVQPLIEGLLQVSLFLGYLTLISRAPDIQRVFQYHGAEHMTIHALEAGDPLTVDEVRKYPTAHHRCGTAFLVIVVMLSIIAFSIVGRQEPLVMVASRLTLIPLMAMASYEVLKLGARFRGNPIMRIVIYPGILVQKITTKRPTDDMIEVAIVSMQEALKADGSTVPDGSTDIPHEPMESGRPPVAREGDGDAEADRHVKPGRLVPPTTTRLPTSGDPPPGA